MTRISPALAIACFLVASAAVASSGTPGASASEPESQNDGPFVSVAQFDQELQSVRVEGRPEHFPPEGTFGYQTVALEMLDKVEAEHRSQFVTGGVDRSGAEEYWISFRERPGEEVFGLLARQPFNTTVTWGHQLNAEQLDLATGALSEALSRDPDIDTFEVSPSPSGQGIEAHYELSLVSSVAHDADEIVARVLSEAASHLDQSRVSRPIPTVMRESELEAYDLETAVRGGHALVRCTTGFTARWSGDLGVITAGHCSDTSLYDGQSGVLASTSMRWPQAYSQGTGVVDVRFLRTQSGHATTKKFRHSNSGHTIVTGVSNPRYGMDICFYGIVSDRRCGGSSPLWVDRVNFCKESDSGLTYCKLARTNRRVTEGGDSGGPWFVDAGAYGIHSGASPEASFFSMAGAMDNYGVEIRQD